MQHLRALPWLVATLLGAALAGCGSDTAAVPNTIRVAVSTDLPIGDGAGQINKLGIDASRPGSAGFHGRYSLTPPPATGETLVALPDSLLLHNGQPFDDTGDYVTTPVEIVVHGRLGTTEVVTRTAILKFITDKPVVLYMPLCQSCAGNPCDAEHTCRNGTCQTNEVALEGLAEDDGTQPLDNGECPAAP